MAYAAENACFSQETENAGMEGHCARAPTGERKSNFPRSERVPGHAALIEAC
jgi:hypothetical protein